MSIKINKEFKDRAISYFGYNADKFLELLNGKPSSAFFLNTKKGNKEELLSLIDFDYSQSSYNPNSYKYDYDSIGKTKAYDLGIIYPQDEESSLPASFVDVTNVKYAIDLCAAPGGKSIDILTRLSNDALLIANDVSYKRASVLCSNIERMGFSNTIITCESPTILANKYVNSFDLVILDAPCSGEGMIRKYPEILDEYSVNNINSLASIQKDLLEDAYKLLNNGGQLLYSTCTYAFEEDETQIINFLNSHNDMEIISFDLKDNYSKLKGTIKLCPLNHTEGQFFCLMKKNSGNNNSFKYLKTVKNPIVEKFIKDNINIDKYYLYKKDTHFYLSLIPLIDIKDHVLNYAIDLGELKKDRFEPNHGLYRSNILKDKFIYRYELNDSDYDRYINGQEIKANLVNSYVLITYKNYALGFGKASNNCLKNKYPKGLRRVL